MSKAPKLRFKEFSGDWQRTTLKQVTNSFEYGMNAAATEFDGKNKYIRITDIDENTSKYLNENVVSPLGELEEKYLVKENDILFARTGASTGKTYLYDSKDGKLYFAGFLIRANVNNDNNAKFIFLQTKTRAYDKWVKVMSMRSGQPGINSQEYASYPFYSPSKEEQEKIASFFSLIDDKISLQGEKLELLKDYKRGMMQKIFSRELKFKDDEGRDYPEWKEKKFKDFTKINQGLQIPISERYTTEGENRYFYITNEFLKSDSETKYYIENPSESVICYEDDILMTRTGNTGKVVTGVKGAFHNNFFKIAYDKDKYDRMFLYYILTSHKMQKNIIRLAGSSTIPDLNHSDFYNIKVKLPILEEQKKISDLLIKLDNKIEKEQEKLDSLNEYKKGLLQQMFV